MMVPASTRSDIEPTSLPVSADSAATSATATTSLRTRSMTREAKHGMNVDSCCHIFVDDDVAAWEEDATSATSFDSGALDSDSDYEDTPLRSRRRSQATSPTATSAQPLLPPHSDEVKAAHAFVQLDRELSCLFSSEVSSWVCRHTCGCTSKAHSYSQAITALRHNVRIGPHPPCDEQCVMHVYMTLQHRADFPSAETRARWAECRRLARLVGPRRKRRSEDEMLAAQKRIKTHPSLHLSSPADVSAPQPPRRLAQGEPESPRTQQPLPPMTAASAAKESIHLWPPAGRRTVGSIDDGSASRKVEDESVPSASMPSDPEGHGSHRHTTPPLSSIQDGLRLSSSSAAHSSSSSAHPPSVAVAFARAFVQLDRDFGDLFTPAESSWSCHHSCARECRTDSFASRQGAVQHNLRNGVHPACDARCAMHKHLALCHRTYAPDAESRARWEECKRLAPDVPHVRRTEAELPATHPPQSQADSHVASLGPAASPPTEVDQHDPTEFHRLESEYQSRRRASRNGRPLRPKEERSVGELPSIKPTPDRVSSELASERTAATDRLAEHNAVAAQLQECQSELVQCRRQVQELQQEIASRDIEQAAHLGHFQGLLARDAILEVQLHAAQTAIRTHQEQEREHATTREERDRVVTAHAAAQTASSQLIADLNASHQAAIEAHHIQQRDSAARETELERQLQVALHVQQQQVRELTDMCRDRDRAVAAHAAAQAAQEASSQRIAALLSDLLASEQTSDYLRAELSQARDRAVSAEDGRDSLQTRLVTVKQERFDFEESAILASHTAAKATAAATRAQTLKRKAEDDAVDQQNRHDQRVRDSHESAARETDLARRLQSAQSELRTRRDT